MREITKVIEVPASLADAKDEASESVQSITLTALEFENIDEAIQEIGGPDNVIKILNRFKLRNAFQAAQTRFNTYLDKIPENDEKAFAELVTSLPTVSRKYTFEIGDGVTGKEAKEVILSVRERVSKLSAEERAALSADEILKMLNM